MSREVEEDIDDVWNDEVNSEESVSTGKYDKIITDGTKKYKLSGMYRDWFLD